MTTEIYRDEIYGAAKKAASYFSFCQTKANKEYIEMPRAIKKYAVIADETTISGILIPSLASDSDNTVLAADAFGDAPYVSPGSTGQGIVRSLAPDALAEEPLDDAAIILLADSTALHSDWERIVNIAAEKTRRCRNCRIIAALQLPAVRELPHGITAAAEREYSFLLEKTTADLTPAEQFAIRFEALCRKAVNDGAHITLLRFDNLFGAAGTHFPAFDIQKLVNEAFTSGETVLTTEDQLTRFTCISARDAAFCIRAACMTAKNGHVYNVTGKERSLAEVKLSLQKLFPEEIALTADKLTYSSKDVKHFSLSSVKFFHEQDGAEELLGSFDDDLYAYSCALLDRNYDIDRHLTQYQGKLWRLKEAEINILREIDRICKKHRIRYFLAAGTMLGAVRNGKSIPWDDDLDIGMLREDFEIFRKVAPRELDKRYIYASPDTKPDCHYFFDKIRLRDTYFSTYYSNQFVLDDGVFVDIIVYDQTTANKLLQKAQIRLIDYSLAAIYVRWLDHPQERYRFAKPLLPLMRIFPFPLYHKAFEKLATLYKNKKDAKLLLDGGQHLDQGGFPKRSLDGRTFDASLDGMEHLPIPDGFEEYLTFIYGGDFREEPAISARQGTHQIARLDLGKYLLSDDPPQTFRAVDLRGELFEKEEEQ